MDITGRLNELQRVFKANGIILRGLRVTTETNFARAVLTENSTRNSTNNSTNNLSNNSANNPANNSVNNLSNNLSNNPAGYERLTYPFSENYTGTLELTDGTILIHDYPWRLEYNYSENLSRQKFFKWRPFFGIIHQGFSHPVGAEIGVFEGFLTRFILEYNQPAKHYLIDPYREYTDKIGRLNYTQAEWDEIFIEAQARFAQFQNIRFIRKPSVEAVTALADNSLDYLYIDGDHTAETVYTDIINWFNKVKLNGIIGGHDFIETEVKRGVFRALVQLMKNNDAEYSLQNGYNDWWFSKDEIRREE